MKWIFRRSIVILKVHFSGMEYLGWAMYKNIINTRLALAVGLALLSNLSFAAEISGLHFMYKDWELACDNTGACRAAGYQADEYLDRPISLLFSTCSWRKYSCSWTG